MGEIVGLNVGCGKVGDVVGELVTGGRVANL